MRSFYSALVSLFIALPALANSAGHHAHVHGHAGVNIAFDNPQAGEIQMVVPAESIYGFEYEPKTATDQKAQSDGLTKLERQISQMVVFKSSLGCQIQKEKINVQAEKDEPAHREVSAQFSIRCKKPVTGSKLSFAFGKFFPRIKEVKGQLLTPSVQTAIDIDNDEGELTL